MNGNRKTLIELTTEANNHWRGAEHKRRYPRSFTLLQK